MPVDERDYQRLKNMEGALLKNPDSRRLLNEAIDKAGGVVPELQTERLIDSRVNARVKEIEEETKRLRQQLLEKDVAETEARTVQKLKRAPYNLSAEEIDQVKALVVEKHKEGELLSMETAARYYIASHTPVAATSVVRTPYSTRGQRGKWDWRKELRDPKSKLFSKGESLNYLKEQYDKAWDDGLELIESQQPQF